MSRASLGLCLAVVLGTPCQATELAHAKARSAAAPRPPVFARQANLHRPSMREVRLAPDGRHVSWLRRTERGIDLLWQDVATGARTRLVAGLDRAETAWSGDGRRLWLADEQGLAVIETAAPRPRRVFRWDPRRSQRLWAVDPRAPRYAILREKLGHAGAERHRYLRIDAQGTTRLLLESTRPLRSILLDAAGRLAFVAAFDSPAYDIAIRRYGAAGPRELLRCRSLEECRLVGWNAAQDTVWLLSNHGEDRLALRRWRASSGRWESVHRDPAAVSDADAVLWSAAREDWLAIAYHGARRRWHGNDGGTRALLATLERRLPGDNLQLSPSGDGRLWLVQAQRAERALDRYFLYHVGRKRLQPLFERQDAAGPAPPPGVPMHGLRYRAGDGRLLHGYVLLPAGVAPATAPLVAWLHGGPIVRLYDRYDPALQLLANRGYAVFVPNFRASSGFGRDYTLSARGDVGNGRVLADIIDGLDVLLAQGVGDRTRQAVMGMSFGGYASLLALTHHPTRFRFAFAAAPPTDYGWIKQWQAEHDSEALRAEGAPLSVQFPMLGFPYRDPAWRQKMHRESPLANLAALRAPIHLWAGARDDHVPLKSIAHYAGELRRHGKALSLLIDPHAGHVPDDPLSADAFLYLMERAAQRHLGGALTPPSKELQAFLGRNLRIDATRGR